MVATGASEERRFRDGGKLTHSERGFCSVMRRCLSPLLPHLERLFLGLVYIEATFAPSGCRRHRNTRFLFDLPKCVTLISQFADTIVVIESAVVTDKVVFGLRNQKNVAQLILSNVMYSMDFNSSATILEVQAMRSVCAKPPFAKWLKFAFASSESVPFGEVAEGLVNPLVDRVNSRRKVVPRWTTLQVRFVAFVTQVRSSCLFRGTRHAQFQFTPTSVSTESADEFENIVACSATFKKESSYV
jgi:hypothetical protein